ncbi:MAG: hypothetical protein ACPGEC_05820 [Flavobacteriales bacterium]
MQINTKLSPRFISLAASLILVLSACTNDNKTDEFEDCEPENISFTNDIIPIFESKCLGCHSGSDPSGDIDLKDFSTVETLASEGRLLSAIKQQSYYPMPPADNGTPLSDCHIETIKTWINEGTKDN